MACILPCPSTLLTVTRVWATQGKGERALVLTWKRRHGRDKSGGTGSLHVCKTVQGSAQVGCWMRRCMDQPLAALSGFPGRAIAEL